MFEQNGDEHHYTPEQVAEMWGLSKTTVRRLFEDDPGVLKICMRRLLINRKHKPHVSLRIPASALERIHSQQANNLRLKRRPGAARPELLG